MREREREGEWGRAGERERGREIRDQSAERRRERMNGTGPHVVLM